MDGKLKYPIAIVGVIVIGIAAFIAVKQPHLPQNTASPFATAPLVAGPPSTPVSPPSETPDCLLPGPAPAIPQGVTSSADDMKLGRVTIQAFVNELETFQKCREEQIANAPATISQAQKDTWRESGNQAIDQANLLASAYSAQLKIFKSKQAGTTPAGSPSSADPAQ